MRSKVSAKASGVSLGKKGKSYSLPVENGGVCEIVMDIDARNSADVTLLLSNKAGEKVSMVYNAKERTMSFDRRESGIVDFSEDFPAVTVAPTHEKDGKVSLRIFIDRSSIELFGNDGRFVMTNLVFPNEPYTTLTLSAQGGSAKVSDLKIYSLSI